MYIFSNQKWPFYESCPEWVLSNFKCLPFSSTFKCNVQHGLEEHLPWTFVMVCLHWKYDFPNISHILELRNIFQRCWQQVGWGNIFYFSCGLFLPFWMRSRRPRFCFSLYSFKAPQRFFEAVVGVNDGGNYLPVRAICDWIGLVGRQNMSSLKLVAGLFNLANQGFIFHLIFTSGLLRRL